MEEFERLLRAERGSVERFVRFRISERADADDLLQEVFLTAYRKFSQLKNKDSFKAWILSIARNKCRDYFRQKASRQEVLMEEIPEKELADGRYGASAVYPVRETLRMLGEKDQQILFLCFWREMPQAEIAKHLHIPPGTVKSRLHTAKQNFKKKYPYPADRSKGESTMKKMPEFMPEYKIEENDKTPFSVKWEELMGWFLVPKLGEKLTWGMYEIPSRKCIETVDMKVIGKAAVHGIEGVELTAKERFCQEKAKIDERTFVAQLTDTHCRCLATLEKKGEVRRYITFLDGDEFLPNWGFGENNCGNETNLAVKGDIKRVGATVTSAAKDFLLDIVGRYTVTIGEKSYDTVCVMDIETYNCGVVTEQFLDENGRTILWRRFNRDDWAIGRYKKKWSEQLPENDRLTVNGKLYVHWYDCITDYIL